MHNVSTTITTIHRNSDKFIVILYTYFFRILVISDPMPKITHYFHIIFKAKIWFWSLQICLVLVLVPVKKICCFWSQQNILFLKIVPPGTIFKSKIFCRDLFKNQKILQGLFF